MNTTRILIAENDAVVAADLAAKLKRLGYGVVGIVSRGEEAVALAGDLRPHLILMDVHLGGSIEGVKAAELIRDRYDVPVIYLMAHADAATLARAKLTGPFGYIIKPFDKRDLATQLELALYKHKAEWDLREQREWLRVTLTSIGDAVITTDDKGCIEFMNPTAESLTGWKEHEVKGRLLEEVFRIINEQTRRPAADIVRSVLRKGRIGSPADQTALIARDGREIPIEDSAVPIRDKFGSVSGMALVFHDVTEKRRAQESLRENVERLRIFIEHAPASLLRKQGEEIRHLNRTLRALGKTNQAMMHAQDVSHLLEAVCRIIVEDCGHPMVWIGFAEDDEKKTVRPVAQAGFEEGYLEATRITWSDTDLGRGPTGTAIRTGIPDVCRDFLTESRMLPWRKNAIERGYASSVALPLKGGIQTLGALTIYSRKQDDFPDAEVKLLAELAEGLAYGITVLRLRLAHQKSEMKLRESQSRLDLALRSAGMGAWHWEIRENRRHFDDQACRLLGIDSTTFSGDEDEFFRVVHPDDRETVKRILVHALEQDRPYETEYRAVWPDGTVHHIAARGRPVRDEKGSQERINGLLWDISERKYMEDELRRTRDELELQVRDRTAELRVSNKALMEYATRLERLNEELQEFAFIASHDLQEPLRKIQTFCDMAVNRCGWALDSKGKDYMDRIVNSAGRMRQLLRDLLQFSRAAAGPAAFKEINLGKTVRKAVDLFEEDITGSGGLLEIEDMPDIEAHEGQILCLFQNLIGNAVKFRSSESPRIRIHAIYDDAWCEIFIKDHGIGFDPRFAERIFKPLQRLNTHKGYEGTGMGLAICRKIVEWHGGSVRAESEPGKGSTFIIKLPLRQRKGEGQW